MPSVKNAVERPGPLGRPRGDSAPADGRAARSLRSRRAIVDAMRALHAEGDLRPTAPRVAERAGVSVRTVWQQFADMETLLVEANRRDFEILKSLTKRIDPDLPLDARVAGFTSQRARILEQMTPTWRAARIHEPFSAELARSDSQNDQMLTACSPSSSHWRRLPGSSASSGVNTVSSSALAFASVVALLRASSAENGS